MDPNDDVDEAFSDYGGSIGTSEFTSVNTERALYSYEAGRRYQGFLQGRYGLPNDEPEQAREALKHKLYVDYLLDGRLFVSPVGDDPQKIVDLGTGTGLWALDVADHYPSARVIGADLSAIQPAWTAPNVEFRVEDLEDEYRPWTSIYTDADLIHARGILQTLRDPSRFVRRAYQNLRPGGWFENHEIECKVISPSGEVLHNHPMEHLYRLLEKAYAEHYGWQLDVTERTEALLRDAGFVNVSERRHPVPIGNWHAEAPMREMGMFARSILEDLAEALLSKHEQLGLNKEQKTQFERDFRDVIENNRVRALFVWVDYWGQKPETATD